MFAPILTGVLLAMCGIIAGWVKCVSEPDANHHPATLRGWLRLVRPCGWVLFAAIVGLSAVNIVLAELQADAARAQRSEINSTTRQTQEVVETAAHERIVMAVIANMVDESQVHIDQARIRVTNDLAVGDASSDLMKEQYVRLGRESLTTAINTIDSYQSELAEAHGLERPTLAPGSDPLIHLEFVRDMLAGDGHPALASPETAFPLMESLCDELETGLKELASRYRREL